MNTSRDYFDPEVLSRLKGLGLRARLIVEGYVSGVHRSPMHGFSVEFAEHREYAPGDDLRYLDWKVYGRSDKFYLKQFEEETNLACHLVLDVSESMTYRGPAGASAAEADGPNGSARSARGVSPMTKLEYAQTVSAALTYLVLHQQDCVALATFDDGLRSILGPSNNPSRLQQFTEMMEAVEPRRKTAIAPVLHELAQRWTRRGIVIVLSDFFDSVDTLLEGLKHLRYRRQEVILFHVLDRAELAFPFDGAIRFQGLEQGAELSVESRALRKAYLREFDEYLRQLRFGCRAAGIDYALMPTDQPVDVALSSYLAARHARGFRRSGRPAT